MTIKDNASVVGLLIWNLKSLFFCPCNNNNYFTTNLTVTTNITNTITTTIMVITTIMVTITTIIIMINMTCRIGGRSQRMVGSWRESSLPLTTPSCVSLGSSWPTKIISDYVKIKKIKTISINYPSPLLYGPSWWCWLSLWQDQHDDNHSGHLRWNWRRLSLSQR